jgi:glutamine amidotransferase-like uncharacterized protein
MKPGHLIPYSSYIVVTAVAVCSVFCGAENKVTVALYSGKGCWDDSVVASEKMFEWMGCDVSLIDAGYVNDKSLDDFGIICFPGGDMYRYADDITSKGKGKLRDFVNAGGGYIGICAGAYFAAEKIIWAGKDIPTEPLGIFPGKAVGIIDEIAPFPKYAMCRVNVVDFEHPITARDIYSLWVLYYWGPRLIPKPGTDVDVLGVYAVGGDPAMVAFEYGAGRVFLIGPVPDIEEDGDRDGTDFAEEFDDLGSDWELMRKAALWCTKELN